MDLSPLYEKFKNKQDCIAYLEFLFWENHPKCPVCRYKKSIKLSNESRYRCKSCKTPFSVTMLTLFHKTKVDLRKWFYAIGNEHLTCRQLAAHIGVTKDTANYMLQRIKVAKGETAEIISIIKKLVYEQYN